ncbi:hypothetical protein DOTSEDRAFT_70709 [Dothistroma septosporum NZE10]|uniref:Aldose 1-epimerase n=1 Tax=Dothistroma septosporum (strain NZE10 / CBS 128990) TaxID=675120 RepID=N1PTP6_DOTSN|nr:hypothetical protein DOTSEDRAFT_70709 [Dothistroma septosporum NZE10]
MRTTTRSLLLTAGAVASAQSGYGSSSSSPPYPPFSGNAFEKLTISAQGINASFIPYGARLTNLYVNDKNGKAQDVAVGYDSGSQYLVDSETNHTFFGAVVGRYANRIKNGTFTLGGVTSHIPENEHGGEDTLHGGDVGYDQRNWTIVTHTNNSITFSFYDDALEGFPGSVLNVGTFSVDDEQVFTSRLVSIPIDQATPIMLAHHIYWNIGAFVDEDAITILNDTLQLPYADRYVQTDGIQIPNGSIGVTKGTGLDFQQPAIIGDNIAKTNGSDFCGTGCVGIDNAFINDRSPYAGQYDQWDVLHTYSPSTGIQLDVSTNQNGLQIYTCVGQNGTIPVKASQNHIQGQTTYVEKYGCIVIETQDWIDGINNPQWAREDYQIFTPTTPPSVNIAKFKFSVPSSSKLTQQ